MISLSDIPKADENTLCVLGNGFDLMHGVKSSYYDFSKTIGKKSYLRICLENYLETDDLWADFEHNLAKLNISSMCSSFLIDDRLDEMNAYDEDATMADYCVAVEMAANPIKTIAEELPKRFRKWVNKLYVRTNDRPLSNIIGEGLVLNFNYTEFVETLYDVDKSNVCYIHGCRKKIKGQPQDNLILGHMPGDSNSAYNFEDTAPFRKLSDHDCQLLYHAQEEAIMHVAEADDILTKHSKSIIKNNISFFNRLDKVNKIIVIGHSLYKVDWNYFAAIIDNIKDANNVTWYIGCYGENDIQRAKEFINYFNIPHEKANIFCTNDVDVNIFDNNDNTVTRKPTPTPKILAISPDNKWEIQCIDKEVRFMSKDSNLIFLKKRFNSHLAGAIFDYTGKRVLLIVKGINKGVFLFSLVDEQWIFIRELIGIPNQGLITKRLCKLYQKEDILTFVYNNRIREYSLLDGSLIINKAIHNAGRCMYDGVDLTIKLKHIYKEGFH